MTVSRRLAAILAADVDSYRRLAGADEDRTLSRLRGWRSVPTDPSIAAHHGRVVKRKVPRARRRFHWTPQPNIAI